MFRRRVETLPEQRCCRRPTNLVRVPIGSVSARNLLIVGPNHRKEKICGSWIKPSKRQEASHCLDARSGVLVICAVKMVCRAAIACVPSCEPEKVTNAISGCRWRLVCATICEVIRRGEVAERLKAAVC